MASSLLRKYTTREVLLIGGIVCTASALVFRWNQMRKPFSAYSTSEQIMHGIDMRGKCAVITGASAGIGKETAKHLLHHNCTVVMACRNVGKAELVKQEIASNHELKERVHIVELDLASMKSINAFVSRFKAAELDRIDYLINNAGIVFDTYKETENGHEIHFGVNYLGHVQLIQELMPYLVKSKGRVLNLSSKAHFLTPKKLLADLVTHASDTKAWFKKHSGDSEYGMYGLSKAMINLITREFSERYKDVTWCSVDPGLVSTDIQKTKQTFGWFYWVGKVFAPLLGKTISQGAATTLRCVTVSDAELQNGDYYADCNPEETSAVSRPDAALQRQLWDFTQHVLAYSL